MSLQNSSSKPVESIKLPCGSIIDAQGREIEITEDMIQKACEDLEKSRQAAAANKKD